MVDFVINNMAYQLSTCLILLGGLLIAQAGIRKINYELDIHPVVISLLAWIGMSTGYLQGYLKSNFYSSDGQATFTLLAVIILVLSIVFWLLSYFIKYFQSKRQQPTDDGDEQQIT